MSGCTAAVLMCLPPIIPSGFETTVPATGMHAYDALCVCVFFVRFRVVAAFDFLFIAEFWR